MPAPSTPTNSDYVPVNPPQYGLKTRIILPYGTLTEWTSGSKNNRVMQPGELGVAVDTDTGAVKLFQGRGTTFIYNGDVNVDWIKVDANKVLLSHPTLDFNTGEYTVSVVEDAIAGITNEILRVEAAYALTSDVSEAISNLSSALSGDIEDLSADLSADLSVLSQSLSSYAQTSAIGISYDSDSKKILFAGGNSTSAEIDATAFIKDGMLSSATYLSADKMIVLAFNTDSGTSPISVDVGDLVDTYTAVSTDTVSMSADGNEFKAEVIEGSITPSHLSAGALWVFNCNEPDYSWDDFD